MLVSLNRRALSKSASTELESAASTLPAIRGQPGRPLRAFGAAKADISTARWMREHGRSPMVVAGPTLAPLAANEHSNLRCRVARAGRRSAAARSRGDRATRHSTHQTLRGARIGRTPIARKRPAECGRLRRLHTLRLDPFHIGDRHPAAGVAVWDDARAWWTSLCDRSRVARGGGTAVRLDRGFLPFACAL